MLKNLPLRFRILFPVLAILALGLLLLILIQVSYVGDMFRQNAFTENKNTAQRYALQIGADIGRSVETARSLAKTLEALRGA